ncbi:ROK family transcriptional regulator [Kocuria sp. cx-116]|uniref:ROK family transcriptional regulator n=1 Tax=Kocuria sp. cx-116 TaxID=2771378 RepID=UPI001682F699|nr:ROK family transcriptional regulator [Kocuria sp. cx-116]MBD2761785.1 ROK family transcriptional regulator [Kocuria sp. cx-116]
MPTPALLSGMDANLAHSAALTLDIIRRQGPQTRPELAAKTGLGRTALTQRLAVLQEAGLVMEGEYGESTGGRNPRLLRFNASAGLILGLELGATSFTVGATDLAGNVLALGSAVHEIAAGPEPVLSRAEKVLKDLLAETNLSEGDVWGVGVGLPGPVEYATGRPSEPPIMPGWDNYPVRERLTAAFQAPVWVDNEVNVLALAELRSRRELRGQDFIYVKIGTGIGAGLVSTGRLHRGAQGSAGDIGHVAVAGAENVACRCGKYGCLEAIAGGGALGHQGLRAAQNGRSPILRQRFTETGTITAQDVIIAARDGDHFSVEALTHSGRTIGSVLSTLVNFFNPSIILMGGGVVSSGGQLLASIRETVYQCSLPLATRDLVLRPAHLNSAGEGGIIGAAHLALDEIFGPDTFQRLLTHGPPRSVEELHAATVFA